MDALETYQQAHAANVDATSWRHTVDHMTSWRRFDVDTK